MNAQVSAENSGREALHPNDEFDAFRAPIDQGKGIEDVATRFGVSLLTVQRRLKLSAVSPKLPTLYRPDVINLDQLMALTLSDEHEAQEGAWFDAQPWCRTPPVLRPVRTSGEVEAAGSALGRFAGIEAYESAGGVVRIDLEEQAIEERSKVIQGTLKTWPAQAKQHAGVIVAVGREGDPEVVRGLVR